jgi:hypothetical protein
VVEYLFPLAMIAFLAIGFWAFRLYGGFIGRVLTEGGFNCAANNNFGQILPAFAFSMVGVGLAAPAALSTDAGNCRRGAGAVDLLSGHRRADRGRGAGARLPLDDGKRRQPRDRANADDHRSAGHRAGHSGACARITGCTSTSAAPFGAGRERWPFSPSWFRCRCCSACSAC